jgi:hypothetical protein
MTSTTHTRPRTIWTDTVVVVSKADRRTQHPARLVRPVPTTQATREKEADRWVAQMMFDHYNG